MTNSQVCWWEVHLYVAAALAAARDWPMAGTPAWCDLPADDPRKLAALLDAAQHWALRVETCQAAECEASHDISAAYDWDAIGRRIRAEAEFYRHKPYLKRRPA